MTDLQRQRCAQHTRNGREENCLAKSHCEGSPHGAVLEYDEVSSDQREGVRSRGQTERKSPREQTCMYTPDWSTKCHRIFPKCDRSAPKITASAFAVTKSLS